MPRVICGASAGSIVASLICTRPYEEMQDLFDPFYVKFDCYKIREDNLIGIIARYLKDGVFFDMNHLQNFLKAQYGDLTFKEVYKRFGWNLNISVSIYHEKDSYRLLNYLTAPTVLIWSAVSASCAIPNVFEPV